MKKTIRQIRNEDDGILYSKDSLPVSIRTDYVSIINQKAKRKQISVDIRCSTTMAALLDYFEIIHDECGTLDDLPLIEFKKFLAVFLKTGDKLNFCFEALSKIGLITIKHLDQESASIVLNEAEIKRCLDALNDKRGTHNG